MDMPTKEYRKYFIEISVAMILSPRGHLVSFYCHRCKEMLLTLMERGLGYYCYVVYNGQNNSPTQGIVYPQIH